MEDFHPSEEIDLQKYWSIIKRHWLPATGVALLPIIAFSYLAFSADKKYEAYGKLKFKRENVTSSLVTEAGEKIGKLDSLKVQDTPLDTEAEVLRSVPIINQTIKSLQIKDKAGELIAYEDFLGNLGVKNIPGTDILTISYSSPDPREATRVVDRVMDNYLKNNIRLNRSEAESAKKFLVQELPIAERSLKQAENNLKNFKTQNRIVDLQAEAALIVQQIGQLDQQTGQIQGELAKGIGRANELRDKVGASSKEKFAESNINNSIAVQDARAKLRDIESQLVLERTEFTEVHPTVIRLKIEKAALENLLSQRINEAIARPQTISKVTQGKDLQDSLTENLVNNEAETKGLIQQLSSLNQIRVAYAQRAQILPQLEQTQKALIRQIEIAENSFQSLIKSLQELEIAEKQQASNAQIVSSAVVSKYPDSPRKKLALLGIVAGGLTFLITAFLLELVGHAPKRIKKVKTLFPYPCLGSISQMSQPVPLLGKEQKKSYGELVMRDHPTSMDSEAYRRILAQFEFLNPEKNIKTVVITSSVQEEGKSMVSANLALANAEIGRKVLLIDADLLNPRQHEIWQVENDRGLSHILEGQANLSNAVKRLGENLDILVSGHRILNPLALLNASEMRILLSESLRIYDYIIIDSPPLLSTTVAPKISSIIDGIVLVVKPSILNKSYATVSKEILQKFRSNILGLIINEANLETQSNGHVQYAESHFRN